MEMRGAERRERTRDRISVLPDEIGHHILSFLPVELVAQTGVLSKRWRSLWHSFPSLDFTTFYQNRLNHQNQGIPLDFLISSVLLNRQPGSKIKLFRLKGFVSSPFLSTCLENLASNHQIEELDLEVPLSDRCEIPYTLLSCKSLRALTLKSENPNARFTFSTSYLMDSPSLKCLHTLLLTCVSFTNSPSIHNHFSESNFPLLKILCLRDCKGISSHLISCPSLELLEITILPIKGLGVWCKKLKVLKVIGCFRISPGIQRWVSIMTPQLREFYWADNPSTEICEIGSFPFLQRLTLDFPNEVPSQVVIRSVATLLSAMSFATSLFFGIRRISLMSKINLAGLRLRAFINLTTLCLQSGLNKHDIPGVACILQCCPKLRKLDVIVHNAYKKAPDIWMSNYHDNIKMTEDQYLASQLQHNKSALGELQNVTINVHGCVIFESTINLVKFLLGFGRVMKTMKITTSLSNPDGPCLWQDWQRKTAQRIKGFKRASPNVKILF